MTLPMPPSWPAIVALDFYADAESFIHLGGSRRRYSALCLLRAIKSNALLILSERPPMSALAQVSRSESACNGASRSLVPRAASTS